MLHCVRVQHEKIGLLFWAFKVLLCWAIKSLLCMEGEEFCFSTAERFPQQTPKKSCSASAYFLVQEMISGVLDEDTSERPLHFLQNILFSCSFPSSLCSDQGGRST